MRSFKLLLALPALFELGCSTEGAAPAAVRGANTGTGGAGQSGAGTGGSVTGGAAPAGAPSGGASGASPTGGTPSGGSATGGTGGGKAGAAGAAAGGTAAGAPATGGTPSGGSAGSVAGGGGGSSGGAGGSAGGGGQGADPCATALLCEDFESYATGQAPGGDWEARTASGAVTVDEAEQSSGAKSAKFTVQSGGGSKTAYLVLEGAGVFPVPGNAFYGRMMFLLESAPTASVHWTFIQATGLIAGQDYHAQYRYGGQQPVMQGGDFVGNQLMANYETPDSYSGTGPGSDCWHHADETVVPVGVWTCVEWYFDGPNDGMRLWLDGQALPDLSVTGMGQGCVNQPSEYPWTAPEFDRLEIGWESYQADDPRTLYIDDVVLSSSPIGCP